MRWRTRTIVKMAKAVDDGGEQDDGNARGRAGGGGAGGWAAGGGRAVPAVPVANLTATVLHQFVVTTEGSFVLQDIYGMDAASGEDCVVCLTDPKDTMLLPCRHMCVCRDCFRQLTRCPLCMTPFDEYVVLRRRKEKAGGEQELGAGAARLV